MSNQFSFDRVFLLIKRRFALRRRALLVSLATMSGIAILLVGANLTLGWYGGNYTQDNVAILFDQITDNLFMPFILISTSVFASQMFAEFGQKDQGITALMIPATHFEKWMVSFLFSTLYFLVAVIGIYYFAQILNILAFNASHPIKIPIGLGGNILSIQKLLPLLGKFAAVHSLYFLGSMHFKDNQWWNTTLVLMVSGGVFGLIMWQFPHLIWPSNVELNKQAGIVYATIKSDGIYSLPVAKFWSHGTDVFRWVLPPVLWVLSFLKLTEKQI